MKEKKFLSHFVTIGIGTIINIFLGFLTTPILTRIVSPDDYGHLSIFTMYTGLAVMILCCGLDQALVRFYYEKNELSYKRSLLAKCIILPLGATFIFGLVVIFLSFNRILSDEFSQTVYVLFSVYVVIEILNRFALLIIRLEYKSKLYSAINVIAKLMYIAIGIPLVIFVNKDNLVELILAYIGSQIICVLIGVLSQSDKWNSTKSRKSDCIVTEKELVKYGFPFIFSLGIMTLFQAIDKISLSMFSSYDEVGIYSSANSIVNVFAVIQTTFNALWGPMAVEHYSQDPSEKRFYQTGNKVITLVMFFFGFSLMLFKDIFALLLGASYRDAALIVPFLVFSPIMYTISETTVTGLVFKKKSNIQIIVSVGACVTNIIGNAILVPLYGGRGAAISTGISYIVFFTLRTFLSNKYYYVNYHLGRFYVVTGMAVIYALINTFQRINTITVTITGYFICIVVLFILYKDVMNLIIDYLKDIVARHKK